MDISKMGHNAFPTRDFMKTPRNCGLSVMREVPGLAWLPRCSGLSWRFDAGRAKMSRAFEQSCLWLFHGRAGLMTHEMHVPMAMLRFETPRLLHRAASEPRGQFSNSHSTSTPHPPGSFESRHVCASPRRHMCAKVPGIRNSARSKAPRRLGRSRCHMDLASFDVACKGGSTERQGPAGSPAGLTLDRRRRPSWSDHLRPRRSLYGPVRGACPRPFEEVGRQAGVDFYRDMIGLLQGRSIYTTFSRVPPGSA